MKNLPDKIYMKPLLMEDGESVFGRCTLSPDATHTIEYVRKDAFVEKIVEWLKRNADDYRYTWFDEITEESGMTDKCIEDFKKYIIEE